MNVFDFVESMNLKYGEDWMVPDLTYYERMRYKELSNNWNNLMYSELQQDRHDDIMGETK